jgi:large subunit ribosomal protein L15
MNLNKLPSIVTKSNKRLGRGYGCGKGGHTSSRGQKGQKSRGSIAIWFEGGQLPLKKRMPFLRGKDRFKTIFNTKVAVNLDDLNTFAANSIITKADLAKAGVISIKEAATARVKVLSQGKIDKPLTIQGLPVSASAAKKILAAGGKVEELNPKA